MAKRSNSKRRSRGGGGAVAAPITLKEETVVNDDDAAAAADPATVIDDENSVDAEETPPADAVALSKSEQTWNAAQSSITDYLLPLISKPEDLLTTLLITNNKNDAEEDSASSNEQDRARQCLITASRQLFQYMEHLAGMEEKLKEMQKQNKRKQFQDEEEEEEKLGDDDADEEEESEPCALSGLPSLYTGQADDEEEGGGISIDAETIWGQVDLQNTSLMPMLKKMIKKLAKKTTDGTNNEETKEEDVIRILDTGAMMESNDEESGGEEEESEEDDDDDDGGDDMSEGSAASDFDEGEEEEGNENDSDEDSDARRIRERMEKSMADMMSDDDDDEMDSNEDKSNDGENEEKARRLKELAAQAASLEEELVDPTREDMRDGFFDLHEMEAFADEEEEMLPDDAYGEAVPEDDGDDDDENDNTQGGKKKKKKKKTGLPHLRDRMGDDDSDSDDVGSGDESDGEEDELANKFEPTSVRRKKYRADDEVDALYELYDNKENDDESDEDSDDEKDGKVDASTMSAADFFGKPNKKLIQGYKAKQSGKNKKKKGTVATKKDDDDADSWDNHDFEEDGMDWKEKDGKEDEEGESDEDGDGDDDDDQIEEEVEEESDAEDDSNKNPSIHELKSQKLSAQTLQLEQDLMAEKPWRMMGEAKGKDRGTDTLLDSTPEFEVAFKPPPILTEEHTADIEEMIKKRIIDEDYDDVVPRELPDIGAHKRGGEAPEVSQEKSKLGLGELYEREYLKKKTGYDRTASEKQTEEDAAKEEMKVLFAGLCSQLDALSNYHFAPRPVADEADVKNRSEDVPAIAMEEVLPLHVSNSRGMAPEEVYESEKKKGGVLKGESELDKAERKRLRNSKKAARRKARKQQHADEKLISKLQPGLGLNNPYEKRKLREELQMARASGKVVVASENKGLYNDEAADAKEYQTSTKFFAKMQENVESVVRGEDDDGGRSKKKRKGLEAGQGGSVYRL